ncbi:phospholipase effector Tle1 domain-containing protein [Pseudomonas fragariae (ex Marin et al. 2024)]|uniref:phospholipase effector Tle1 domain-containing protein n=1 Tax=Pseudomonas fragariae (ex Marin et al. 2024) TaxID=3080056 RepID=UPI003F78F0BF
MYFLKNLLTATVNSLISLLLLAGLAACTPSTPMLISKTVSLAPPELRSTDLAPVAGFSKCLVGLDDARLIQEITRGEMIPDSLGGLEGVRLPLSIQEMNQWSSQMNAIMEARVPLVIDPNDTRPVFLAVFDGTWNDRDDTRLPMTVPGALSRELELSEASTPGLSVHYYEGVGTTGGYLRRLWDGSTGAGTRERAERALSDFKAFARAQQKTPHVYVIGFSRGAASARYFLNLVDPYLTSNVVQNFYNRGRSFTLLLDTVATGQYGLQLGIPQATVSAVQFRATRERRLSFPVVLLRSAYAKSRPGQTLLEFEFAAAHADLGGGYGKGLERLSLGMARALLIRQGFDLTEDIPQTQALLNLGRHNSDWPLTPLANALRDLNGPHDRLFVDPGAIKDRNPENDPVMESLESALRIAAADRAALDRLDKHPPADFDGISIYFTSSDTDHLVLNTNCPQYVQFDLKSHWMLLAGKPLFQVPTSVLDEAKAGRGSIWIFGRQDARQFIPNKAR